jgi:hypothetical protein
LKWWAAKQAAIYAANNLAMLSAMKTEAERVDIIKGAPFRKTGDSSDVGNKVHDWIDTYAKRSIEDNQGKSLPRGAWEPIDLAGSVITARRMWNQFVHLANHYEMIWLHSEITVWSDKYEYAGTGDAVVSINGQVVFTDWKTGNGVYPEVGMQLAALANADYALDADGNQFALPKPDMYAVGHVRPTYTRLSPVANIDSCFKAFLGLREVHRWQCETEQDVLLYAPKIEGPKL